MTLLRLPPNPPGIGLVNADSTRISEQHPFSKYDPRSTCVTCRGLKTFRWYAPGSRTEIAEYECDCIAQYRLVRALLNSGIWLNYATLGWDDYVHITPEATAAAVDFMDHRDAYLQSGIGMTISGTHGNGKSLLAYLIVKGLFAEGVQTYSTTFSDMIESFTKGWPNQQHKDWWEATIRHAPVLYIDDLGRERRRGEPGNVGENMLETVIRSRVASNLSTIITTNLSADDVSKGYGGATMSLLSEKSIPVAITGADRRREMQDRTLAEVREGLSRPVVLR